MPLIQYKQKRFDDTKLEAIDKANKIIREYSAQGFDLTLRQLYYQFVARGWIPNTQADYKKLGDLISDARLAGKVDWDAIVDRTRNMQKNQHWESPGEIVDACVRSYKIDKWVGQEYRVEVWIEKDALVGVIEKVCRELDVPYFSCRGYTSQSEMWSAAQRLIGYQDEGQQPRIIHLGDHDPSGKDMTRDIRDRMELFGVDDLEVIRIALNMDQVRKYNPPPNPAKVTDPRAGAYIKEFGRTSWELDALDPKTIRRLIEDRVAEYRDDGLMGEREELEALERKQLEVVARKLKNGK